ncbi:hypothetical protein BC567DRAFT_212006 [Phyllosticta citribraziliensis]
MSRSCACLPACGLGLSCLGRVGSHMSYAGNSAAAAAAAADGRNARMACSQDGGQTEMVLPWFVMALPCLAAVGVVGRDLEMEDEQSIDLHTDIFCQSVSCMRVGAMYAALSPEGPDPFVRLAFALSGVLRCVTRMWGENEQIGKMLMLDRTASLPTYTRTLHVLLSLSRPPPDSEQHPRPRLWSMTETMTAAVQRGAADAPYPPDPAELVAASSLNWAQNHNVAYQSSHHNVSVRMSTSTGQPTIHPSEPNEDDAFSAGKPWTQPNAAVSGRSRLAVKAPGRLRSCIVICVVKTRVSATTKQKGRNARTKADVLAWHALAFCPLRFSSPDVRCRGSGVEGIRVGGRSRAEVDGEAGCVACSGCWCRAILSVGAKEYSCWSVQSKKIRLIF